MSEMPNVDLIRAAYGVIVAYGKVAALVWDSGANPPVILYPIYPGAINASDLIDILHTLEFVDTIEGCGFIDKTGEGLETMQGLKIVCHPVKTRSAA